MTQKELNAIRKDIDQIDQEILRLIEKRECYTQKAGVIKSKLSNPPVYYCPEREREIIDRLTRNYKGHFPKDAIGDIFKLIIKNCRLLQEK